MPEQKHDASASALRLVIYQAVLTLLLIIAGWLFYREYARNFKQIAGTRLETLNHLKCEQVSSWRRGLITSAQMLQKSSYLGGQILLLKQRPQDLELRQSLYQSLDSMRERLGCARVLLMDPEQTVLVAAPEDQNWMGSLARAQLENMTNDVLLTDIHVSPVSGRLNLDMFVALNAGNIGEPVRVGNLMLEFLPEQQLYPLLKSWPVPQNSAENLLLRVEKPDAVLLNPLLLRTNGALVVRYSLADTSSACSRICNGERQAIEDVDLDGTPILVTGKEVPASNWYVLSKINLDEAYGPMLNARRLVFAVVAFVVISLGLLFRLVWRQQELDVVQSQLVHERQRKEFSERMMSLMRQSYDPILLLDGKMQILEANDRAEEIYGYTRQEFMQMQVVGLFADKAAHTLAQFQGALEKEGHLVGEMYHSRKNGTEFPVEYSVRKIHQDNQFYFQVISRDITERKRMEAIWRAVLEGTAGAIGQEFFCSLVQKLAGSLNMCHAMVARIKPGRPDYAQTVAVCENNQIVENFAYALAGTPCEHVVQKGHCFYPQNIQHLFPRDQWLVNMKVQSYLGTPLYSRKGEVLGVMAVMNDQVMREDARTNDLLHIFAARASAELERILADEKTQALEEERKQLLDRVEIILERLPLACMVMAPDFSISYWNPSAEKTFGFVAAEAVGRKPNEIIVPLEERDQVGHTFLGLAKRKTPARGENFNLTKEGNRIFCRWHNTALTDHDGRLAGYLSMAEDITELRQSAQALRESEGRLRAVLNASPDQVVIISRKGRFLEVLNSLAEQSFDAAGFVQGRMLGDVLPPQVVEPFQHMIETVVRTGEPSVIEYELNTAQGRRYFEGRISLLREEVAGETALVLLSREITRRKLVEETLRFTQFAVDHAGEAAFWMGEDGRFFYVNESACLALNYSRDEMVTKTVPEIFVDFPPDKWAIHWRELRLAGTMAFETQYLAKGGHIFPIEVKATYVRFGGREYNCAFARDISARKLSEAELRDSEARYRRLVENSPDAILVHLNGQLVYVNPSACRLLGATTADELVDRMVMDLACTDSREELTAHLDLVVAEKAASPLVEICFQRMDGHLVTVELASIPFQHHGQTLVHAVARDITDRKQSEKLTEVQRDLARAISSVSEMQEGISLCLEIIGKLAGADMGAIYIVNRQNGALLLMAHKGMSPALIEAMRLPEAGSPPAAAVRTAKPLYFISSDPIMRMAPVRTAQLGALAVIPVLYEGRAIACMSLGFYNPEGLSTTLRPAVESLALQVGNAVVRLQTQEALRSNEALYRSLIEASPDGVVFADLDGRLRFVNRQAATMAGLAKPDDMIGHNLLEYIRENDQAKIKAGFAQTQEAGNLRSLEVNLVRTPDHSCVVELSASAVQNEAGKAAALVCVLKDITDRKQLELRYYQSQRLERMGRLASGVAHDLNNVLSPVLMTAQILREEINDPALLPLIATVEDSAVRGSNIIKQLLTFARGIEVQKVPLPVRRVLGEMVRLVRETFPKNCQVQSQLPDNLWPVVGNATQLHQVFLNLCVNARDAMLTGGTLTLSAENLEVDEHYARMLPEAQPGSYVRITVGDTGMGIPPEIMDRIFDPFFTTKEQGKGTGLGLATVLGIVKGHEGFIQVSSTPGNGSRFVVYLPATTVEVPVLPEAEAPIIPKGNGECILVVDDEDAVRMVYQKTLERNGYQVMTAADGTEALARFAEQIGQVKLVLTDMMMPHMDGLATIRSLRRMAPHLPIIAATGVDGGTYKEEALKQNIQAFLIKPFNAECLLRTVHEALRAGI
jgi:PAS domain S-box-containing protein